MGNETKTWVIPFVYSSSDRQLPDPATDLHRQEQSNCNQERVAASSRGCAHAN